MEALLDSSFIISCLKKKIDFLSQLEEQGFVVKIPLEVFEELKDLRFRSPREERAAIDLALQLFEQQKIKKIRLGHKKVDEGLIDKGLQGYYIATLDREIKRAVPHVIVLFDAEKRVGPESS